jgi:hypothetical protein
MRRTTRGRRALHRSAAAIATIVACAASWVGGAGAAATSVRPEVWAWLGLCAGAGSGVRSIVELGCVTGPTTWASLSHVESTVGFLWQEFGIRGRLGGANVAASVLLGPSTSDFLFAQGLAALQVGGLDAEVHCALLGSAVLGGPSRGFAVRAVGQVGGLEVVSTTEMGARIADDDFDGMDVVHRATGLSRHYETDPTAPGRGLTGEKLTVDGWSLGGVGGRATVYVTRAGVEFLAVTLEDVASGPARSGLDLEARYDVDGDSLSLTPHAALGGQLLTFEPRFVVGGDSLGLVGFVLSARWDGVTIRDVRVLDPARYVIATEGDQGRLEAVVDAVKNGHEYDERSRELLSIVVVWSGPAGENRAFVDTSFEGGSGALFKWGKSHVAGAVGLGGRTSLSWAATAGTDGLDELEIGLTVSW